MLTSRPRTVSEGNAVMGLSPKQFQPRAAAVPLRNKCLLLCACTPRSCKERVAGDKRWVHLD